MSSPGDRTVVSLPPVAVVQGNEVMYAYSPNLAVDARVTPATMVPYFQQFIEPGAPGAQGLPGPQGPTGPIGATGPQGPESPDVPASIGMVIDGGGGNIPVGTSIDIPVPFDATITAVEVLATSGPGSIVIDVQTDDFAGYPTFTSITGGSKPTLSLAEKYRDEALSGWNTELLDGNIVRFRVDSCAGVSKVTISLEIMRAGGGGGGGGDNWWEVNVLDFAPVPAQFGQGFAIDEGLIIQEAIDWAFNNGKSAVRIPDGCNCKISRPIWLAPPGSYNSVDPQTGGSFSAFQFSMALIGGEGIGNGLFSGVNIEAYGTDINGDIDFNNGYPDYPLVVVGPGQGMRVAGLNIGGASGSLWPTTFPNTSIGIAISGGPAGASRTLIERCWIQKVFTGIRTGWNEDSLGDSNTFFKCVIQNCYYGIDIFRTQNYINNIIDCNISGVIFVNSVVGKAVNVWGGNFSHAGGVDQDFNISGTTAMTPGPAAAMQAFNTTLSFPGIGLGGLDIFSENALVDGGMILYNAAAIETAHFGVIPLRPLSYNSTTNVMSLMIEDFWISANFGISPDFSTTDLQAEIQAATLLMMGVRRIALRGTGIHARGVHFESPSAVTALVEQVSGFQGDRGCTIEDLYLNWDPPRDTATLSQRKLMSCWPWINNYGATDIVVRGGLWATSNELPFLFATDQGRQIIFENMGLEKFNMSTAGNFFGNINSSQAQGTVSPIRGFGIYRDRTPFLPFGHSGGGINYIRTGLGQHPHKGVVPDEFPPLTQSYVDTFMSGSLPAKGDYPPLFGNMPYRIARDGLPTTTAPKEAFLVSHHDFYSYGQNFSVNWSYKGQSHHLYVDDVGWFFPGLKFGIDNGSGVKYYVVIGIYPNVTLSGTTGYLIVHRYTNDFSPVQLFGDKNTVFTGSTIVQEPYALRRYGGSSFNWVSAADFPGFDGTGVSNCAPAIQAAIDYALLWDISTVIIPEGSRCLCHTSIWLDPPTSMRVFGAANPNAYQFSIALVGGSGDGNGIGKGATIYAEKPGGLPADFPAIVVGPGQGMRVVGISVIGVGSLFTSFPEGSIGIAISGGDGGASRSVIERCWVQSFKVGMITGWNRDALADSNTFIKCTVEHCRYGVWIARSQNYINSLFDCNIGQCTFNVYSNVGKAVNIFGGNYSSHGLYNHDHTCGSTTALSSVTNEAGTYLGRFSTTLSGLDALAVASFTDNGLCVFTRFGFETARFGVVPCIFVSFNSGTSVLTLDLDPFWTYTFYGFNADLSTATRDLQAELQAVTTVMCCEVSTTFFGSGIHVHGAHIENPVTVTTLSNSTTAIAGDGGPSFEDVYVNCNFNSLSGASLNKMQAVTPMFFLYSNMVTEINKGFFGSGYEGEQVVCSYNNGDLIVKGNNSFVAPNCWIASNTSTFSSVSYIARGFGIGHWEKYQWFQSISSDGFDWLQRGRGQYPSLGYRPAPGQILELTPAMYALVTAAAPIATSKNGYPALSGRTVYRVADVLTTTGIADGYLYFVSDHTMYSWGQNLTINWTYKGKSTVVYVSGTDIGYLFPGLRIGLDNGSGVVYYSITGKSTLLGYVTVDRDLDGIKTTVYTGATIFQENYSFVNYSPPLTELLTILTDAATVAINMALGINFTVTLGGNRTLGNPTNPVVGQRGTIVVKQDGTGTRTLAYGGNYKFVGGTAPVLTVAANAEDYLDYFVETATRIFISARLDVK